MRKIILLPLLLLIASSFTLDDCDSMVKKVNDAYMKLEADKSYTKYESYQIINGRPTSTETTEFWVDHGYSKIKNSYLTIFGDPEVVVYVSDEDKRIIIQDAAPRQKPHVPFELNKDSLNRYAQSLQCEVRNAHESLFIQYNDKAIKVNGVKSSRITLNPTNGELKRIETECYTQGRWVTSIEEYLTFKREFNTTLKGVKALDQVMTDGTLREKYRGYTLKDIRVHN